MKASLLNDYPEGYIDLDSFTEPVVYELLSLKPDPDNPGKWLAPFFMNIPAHCKTVFKGKKNGKEFSKVVNIGYIVEETAEGSAIFGDDINFGQSSAFGPGRIVVSPERGEHAKWAYLECCTFNESSPWRRPNDPIYFRKVNQEKKMADSSIERELKFNAMQLMMSFSDDQLIKHSTLLNQGNTPSLTQAKHVLGSMAEQRPKEFLNMFENENPEGEALYYAKEACSLKYIKQNSKTRNFVWSENDAVITGFKTPTSAKKELAKFLLENEDIFDKVKALVDASK